MARAEKNPIQIPSGVTVTISGQQVAVKGGKGALEHVVHDAVAVSQDAGMLHFKLVSEAKGAQAQVGTARALLRNMVIGVSEGFQKQLDMVGVGYRAQAQGNKLNLSLGFSHPIEYAMPEGVSCETPSQTQILIKGIDKQKVGQVAAEIRAFRPPEPYKGKGVRYSTEHVVRKEAKKK